MFLFFEIILLTLGFTLLSLSLPRHFHQVSYCKTNIKRKQFTTRHVWIFRGCGYALLFTSIFLTTQERGITLGLVYWFASATLVTLLLSLILSFKPRWLAFIPSLKLPSK